MSSIPVDVEYLDIDQYPNIRNISAIYSKLREALFLHRAVVAAVPDGAEADLSFIQLLEAARRDAIAGGKDFRLARPASGALLKTLERSGILAALDREGQNFWLHNEVIQ